jgi:L-ascorbate metabolism protein UlaG (beta-lactamase superfamily)
MRSAALLALCLSLTGCGFLGRALSRNLSAPPERTVPRKLTNVQPAHSRLSVLWVGHATVLIQMDDLFVLTDPVFTHKLGQLNPRLVEPGLDARNVPKLGAVLISHMHLDHLSFSSLDMIEDRTPIVLIPPGAKSSMPRYDFEIRELDTWQSYRTGELTVTAVPVQHVGGRYGIDQAFAPRAFTGYVLEYHGLSVYFGGDTAYNPSAFRATRARFPKLSLALIPICPDSPRDFMEHTHAGPTQALDAFELLGAERMMPIHYDTFINSDDPFGQCPRELERLMRERSLDAKNVAALRIGEQRVLIPE